MPKEYFALKDFDKLFGTEPAENAEAPQMSESLSGQAQLLKSADNAVAYKNLNGDNIEQTHLFKEGHIQNITADQTDEYTDGVNSNVTHIAPDINEQISLSQSHNTTHNTLNETVNTQNEAHSIKMNHWQVFHQNVQTQIPKNLQQKIQVSGSSTIDTQQSQIGVQNIESGTYTQNFGNLTTGGPTTVSGSTFNHSSQKFIIGGPSEAVQKQLAPISSEQTSPVYEFYIVNTEGVHYHLTDSFDFSDYMGDFNLGDFFEEERWLPKGDEGMGSFTRGQVIKAGAAGTVAGAAVFTNSLALKKGLINAVQGLFPNIKTQAPNTGGLLLQANYQVAETEVGSDARLNNIFIIGPGTDYNAMIKQAISQPTAIAAPINNMYHWEYLYIWVIKY